MKTLLLLFISSILFLSCIAQSNNIDNWDKDWRSKNKRKLKHTRIGNRAAGTIAYLYYYKSNKSIYGIVKLSRHGFDSATAIIFNFQNDTLFRVHVTRTLRDHDHTRGSAIIYLKDDKLIDQKVKGAIFIPSIPILIDSSYKMLEYAKRELSWRIK